MQSHVVLLYAAILADWLGVWARVSGSVRCCVDAEEILCGRLTAGAGGGTGGHLLLAAADHARETGQEPDRIHYQPQDTLP